MTPVGDTIIVPFTLRERRLVENWKGKSRTVFDHKFERLALTSVWQCLIVLTVGVGSGRCIDDI